MPTPASLVQDIQRHHQNGDRVIATSSSWKDSKLLLADFNLSDVSSARHEALAFDALIRKVEDGLRSGVPFFDQPTAIVVADPGLISQAGMDSRWETVKAAAARSPNPVVFFETHRLTAEPGRTKTPGL